MYVLVFYSSSNYLVGGISTDLGYLQTQAELLLGLDVFEFYWQDNLDTKTQLENITYTLIAPVGLRLNDQPVDVVEISLHSPNNIHGIGY